MSSQDAPVSGETSIPSSEIAKIRSVREIKYIVALSLTEIGLGSLVHGLKIPGGGHFLSLNQGLLLTQFSKEGIVQNEAPCRRSLAQGVARVSLASGMLKSLSPAGQKLTPMLAISVQGLLYALGLTVGGANRAGMLLGSVLLSLWSFLQPLLMAWIFVGSGFFKALSSLWQKTLGSFGISLDWGLGAFAALVLVKISLAAGLVFLSSRFGKSWHSHLGAQGKRVLRVRESAPGVSRSAWSGALRDLLSPIFLISLLLSLSFAYFNDSTQAALVWAFLRPLVAAFAIFYLMRAISPRQWSQWLKTRNPALAERISQAQEALSEEI